MIQHKATTSSSSSHEPILRPNPDYWIARLYKKTVGLASIGPILSLNNEAYQRPNTPLLTWGCCTAPGRDTLLVHSFCAAPTTNPSSSHHSVDAARRQFETKPGDVTLVIINLDAKKRFSIKLPLGTLCRSWKAMGGCLFMTDKAALSC